MDKLLAMSILSSTPADLSAGQWPFWVGTLRMKKAAPQEQRAAAEGRRGSADRDKADEQQRDRRAAKGDGLQHRLARARFAPELDGIDVFETLIPYS